MPYKFSVNNRNNDHQKHIKCARKNKHISAIEF